jgi:hypothetical protein
MVNNFNNIYETNNHLSSQILNAKKTKTYVDGNPSLDLEQAQKRGRINSH